MRPVAVASDSTSYLPRELARREGVHEVSLYVGWGDDPQRELDMDGFADFYARLRLDPELPTTSQPSIGDFLALWEPLIAASSDVVSIHLAGGISGTCEAARQAHALLGERGLAERVTVIDSETACGGIGLLVLAACAAARAGADMEAVVARTREARQALRIWFCVDTLEYLRRGGAACGPRPRSRRPRRRRSAVRGGAAGADASRSARRPRRAAARARARAPHGWPRSSCVSRPASAWAAASALSILAAADGLFD